MDISIMRFVEVYR